MCQYLSSLFSFLIIIINSNSLIQIFPVFKCLFKDETRVTSGNMAFKLLSFTDLFSKLFLNNFKHRWDVINTDCLNTSSCKKLKKVFISNHYWCPLKFLWRTHCWKNCKICPICDLASKIMYKIIYISLIKWSKTREHAEHICSIADSAVLPVKHAYRIKISSAMSLDHITSQKWQKGCSGTVTLTDADVTSAI